MKQLFVYMLLVLMPMTSIWGQQEPASTGLPFQVTALCDGRPVTVTFSCHPKRRSLAMVGVGNYGQPAIDTATAGRLVLPDSVTDGEGHRRKVYGLSRQAFAHCTRLTEVVLPDSLAEIGDQAFYGCSALHELALPPALHVIYPFAFRGCSQLSIIRVRCCKRPAVYDNIFDQQTLDRATLLVPSGMLTDYANSLVFDMFRYRFEELE